MITVNTLCKEYSSIHQENTIRALESISFRIEKGEFVSVLGPSGCGKTTLLNLIAGFLQPTSGTIEFNGKRVKGPFRDRIVVFQEHNLFGWKTVHENIEFGLKAQGVEGKQRRKTADTWIKLVHLDDSSRSYPQQLSGGMKQRVALARALAVDPLCILMDEPLGSLDPQMRERLQVEILNLWQKTKKTILMVTHDIEEAVFMSQRVLLMSRKPGTIKEDVYIDVAYPRKPSIKMSAHFQDIKRRLWETVMC